MLEITKNEYLDILFNTLMDKLIVEKVVKTKEANITTLSVNYLEQAMRIITRDGVVYYRLH